ncbi:putative 7TM-DISM receptor fused with Diguanylate cyclase [Vibrio nigripulchritudo MADA3029]|uniref:sensor domain-containing diguanylate cyclase n=1 Tax=Vibrio nigripulchritudo TaxID=28173 RepID=UPI0003B1B830|nr:diguanylate cyclase [Vibrio nigripulchritudo]CCN45713.1 putative 7TM-DISM receptor fused with Diguanylate cyclase [Vibrio nigripulchritudo MADA3020]CCN52944.1 putative 7TM-DISM receptor fused with Diguanylate cyclase [Vibrio nigripulchritudo MADA3021]CCN61620.1 putative 7TM-DISM receptor fused with Diguanylate cyclase [Vibrio nigripulchritudo MADA3029]
MLPSSFGIFAMFLLQLLVSFGASASVFPIEVSGDEEGKRITGRYLLWHDASGEAKLSDAVKAFRNQEFKPLSTKGSTGLQPGAFWSIFALTNTTNTAITVHLEYIDHQLIYLDAYQRSVAENNYEMLASLFLGDSFSERLIPHQRFVVPVTLEPNQTYQYLFRYGSDGQGYVFPDLRIWNPQKLNYAQSVEVALISIGVGSLLLMALTSFVVGSASNDRVYMAYGVYAIAKTLTWPTILGFTHMFVLQDNFHWNLMSLGGALSIMTGIIFVRSMLQTREKTPKLDWVLKFMILNTLFLALAAVFRETALAVIFMTIALLLYPFLAIAGIIRWIQGSIVSAIYTVAWGILVGGLFAQAMRDLGYVEHNFFTYYWPVFASFGEMAVILIAMGIRLLQLRRRKDNAETLYRRQLERAKYELEMLVSERTHALEQEKQRAEIEARTDPLTGISNRRNFMKLAEESFDKSLLESKPLAVIMFDLDHFKEINDRYGHSTGDKALKLFASTISGNIPDNAIFGRLGGEEFCMAFHGDQVMAMDIAEFLRSTIENISIDNGERQVRFTTSVGISVLDHEKHIDQLITNADKALYRAKYSGRNKVVVA